MNQNLFRIYTILCLWALRLQLWAQDDSDENFASSTRREKNEMLDLEEMQEMVDSVPIHITLSDVLTIIFLVVCCYVFGKIWKGCTYIILILAAIIYSLNKFYYS
ncbi:hypothetical protein [Prevotella sp. E2-28]|uniref:hypothetical protein n=1 Tax=Prevotella sp. E2-28 TaxID=2913620 RepID=UPI001EDB8855|nr:hypothetical protein [Prevotella sp. E2-28]UKK53761.1 hypothetical protein L6465_00370 [Prevotella sp. E2-28]